MAGGGTWLGNPVATSTFTPVDAGFARAPSARLISRLAKCHLILRVKKHGALPNRYRVLLKPAAPKDIAKAKRPARRRTEPARTVKASVPEPAAVPQKCPGGRRRKDSRPLLVIKVPDLFE